MISLKNFFFIIIFSLLLILFQSEILKPLLPSSCIPNLFLVGVIFLSFADVSFFGVFFSFLLGLFFDMSSGELLGPSCAAFVSIFVILTLFSGRIFIDTIFSLFILTVCASIVCDIIYIILIYTFMPNFEIEFLYILLGSISTAIFAPLVIFIFKKFYILKKDR